MARHSSTPSQTLSLSATGLLDYAAPWPCHALELLAIVPHDETKAHMVNAGGRSALRPTQPSGLGCGCIDHLKVVRLPAGHMTAHVDIWGHGRSEIDPL